MAQIDKGTTYSATNSTVTIENLNAHVGDAKLRVGAITDQTIFNGNAPSTARIILADSGVLYQATMEQAMGGVLPANALLRSNNLSDLNNVATAKTNLQLNNVDNLSANSIRAGITSTNVISALGYTPLSGITSTNVIDALGYTPLSGITSANVTTALGFTPLTSAQTQALTTSQLSAISVNAGTGLTGGGPISANSTISLAALSPSPAGTFGSSTQLPVLTVNSLGQVTTVTTAPVSSLTTAQAAAITTQQLAGISMNAGTGLTGGGTIDQNRTFSLAALATNPAGSYGAASLIPTLTVDQFGRVTSAATVPSTVPTNVTYLLEPFNVVSGTATGTINFDVTAQPTLFYTQNATGNFTLNIRGNSTTLLNSLMSNNQSLTVTFMFQVGTTVFSLSALQIDGVTQTVSWAGGSGTAPTVVASQKNSYVFTIVKTGTAVYTVFGSLARFA